MQNFYDALRREEIRTNQLCEDDPFAKSMRDTLREIERKAHATGWAGPNSSPKMFQIDHKPGTDKINLTFRDDHNYLLDGMLHHFDDHVLEATEHFVSLWEEVAAYMKTGEHPASWRTSQLRDVGLDILKGLYGQTDIVVPRIRKPGWRVHGFGMRAETLALFEAKSVAPEVLEKFQSTPNAEPDGPPLPDGIFAKETRMVTYVGRDGEQWNVLRIRAKGLQPIVACRINLLENQIVDPMAHLMSRFVGCVVNNPVPVLPILPEEPAAPVQYNKIKEERR